MDYIRSLYARHRLFILYGLIGASGATLDFFLYLLLYRYYGLPPVIASFLSVSAGIINNFVLNSRHNFQVSDKVWMRFGRFYGIGAGGAVLSALLIFLFYDLLRIHPIAAKIITIIPVVIVQFILNKRYSFKDYSLKGER